MRLLCTWHSAGKNTGVGCHAPLQGIFPTQGSNPHLLCLQHWQADSFPLVPTGKVLQKVFCNKLINLVLITGTVLVVFI